MQQMSFLRKSATATATAALCIALAITPAQARKAAKADRGMEPRHQPVVDRTDFIFDLQADGSGALSSYDEQRLTVWFNALRLGYGDHVSLAGLSNSPLALRDGINDVVGRYGLLVEGDAPITVGEAPVGGLRVVVSRSVASVPSCPSWRDKAEANFHGGLTDNYGCATANNLAAMIADPRDLIEGRSSSFDVTNGVSSKAIKTYRDKEPTGAGGLQAESAGGN